MSRKVITTLKGRQLELVQESGEKYMRSINDLQMAQGRAVEHELALQTLLEAITGDKDPATLIVDQKTGEVYREGEKTVGRKLPKRRATTKGSAKAPKGGK